MLHRPENPNDVLGRIDGGGAAASPGGLDVLVVSTEALWPLDRDDRGIGCRVARELNHRGLRVGVASVAPTPRNAQAWLSAMLLRWPEADGEQTRRFLAGWAGPGKDLRHLIARRQGLKPIQLAGLVALLDRYTPKLVIGLGQSAPALLAGVKSAHPETHTVWLGPDCPSVSAARQLLDIRRRRLPGAAWHALGKTLETAVFARRVDRVLGYTPADALGLRLLTLTPRGGTLRRGLNLKRYFPATEPIRPCTAVTWAADLSDPALADAMVRFARAVWPRLLEHFPNARWRIIGPHAPAALKALEKIDGIKLVGPLADVRQYARRCRVALFPTRQLQGGGKAMAEALALGVPTVAGWAAARALGVKAGPRPTARSPMLACGTSRQWFEAVARLWTDPACAQTLSHHARAWVTEHADASMLSQQLAALLPLPQPILAREAESLPSSEPERSHAGESENFSTPRVIEPPEELPEARYRRAA